MSDLIQNTRESIYNRLELLFKLVEKLQMENRKYELKIEILKNNVVTKIMKLNH